MADEYAEAFEDWLVESVTVQRYLGPGPKGPVLAEPEAVDGLMINYKNRLVKGTTDETRLSDAQITTTRDRAAKFPPESMVTLPDGQKRQVLSRAIDPPQVPLAHCRVVLV